MGKRPKGNHGVSRGHLIRLPPPEIARSSDSAPTQSPSAQSAGVAASSSSCDPTYNRGSQKRALEIASSERERDNAVLDFRRQFFAETTAQSREAQLRLWDQLSACAGFTQLQLTAEHVVVVAAILKSAGYRSAFAYVSVAKHRHIDSAFPWTEQLVQTYRNVKRACLRDIGPPSRAAPFLLDFCQKLPESSQPLIEKGPVAPRALCVVSVWWLLREIEASHAKLADISFIEPRTVRFTLPKSKVDLQSKGTFRDLVCVCGHCPDSPALLPKSLCPVCTVNSHVEWLKSNFGTSQVPLFPDIEGFMVSKNSMVSTIASAAQVAGEHAKTRSGTNRWGGHAWRRGGVHFLAQSGVPVLEIQMHARHSSTAILAYLEGAHVSSLSNMFAKALSPNTHNLLAKNTCTPTTPATCKYIRSSTGVIHQVSTLSPHLTVCRWAWTDTPGTAPAEQLAALGEGPQCRRCWKIRVPSYFKSSGTSRISDSSETSSQASESSSTSS